MNNGEIVLRPARAGEKVDVDIDGPAYSSTSVTWRACTCNSVPCSCYPQWNFWWPYSTTTTDKVRLTMEEAQALKDAAAKDEKLRDALRKLVGRIEVALEL